MKFPKIPIFRALPQKGFFAQIIQLETLRHWICISGHCELKQTISIDVWDSLNSNIVDDYLISQVSSLFKCYELENFEFIFHRFTGQLDGASCGIHAIANSIVLCNDGYPDCHVYFRNEMRDHLISIIENGDHIELFNSEIFELRSRTITKKAKPVFCYCRKPEDGKEMVQCSRCFEWFHLQCLITQID